ncbi:MAG TPA: hypothetical protein DEQ14_02675, partial [Treponema sp.]|nr:hypothetical protein [Treponema sp.]
RNLAEFSGKEEVFNELTCLLHQKTDTSKITMKVLVDTFKKVIDIPMDKDFSSLILVENKVYELANSIKDSVVERMELEDKVILSMAIRLKAEKFLIAKIDDKVFVDGITADQTYKLVEKFKQLFSYEKEVIKLMDKVNLMTPENIHINSFMYEPILDMSNDHLKKLYTEISGLKS